MRFGVLGPLAVWTADGEGVRVPELKVRRLLADLLAHRGRPVPADRLIDDLWGTRPPANPAAVLQTKVSQLRRALEDAEPGARDLVRSEPAGFALRPDEGALDADTFTALTRRAHAAQDPRARVALLGDALALWRGAAFADFGDEEFARPWAVRLEEERLAALEHLAEARLELGEHHLLTGELADLVSRHPLRERLRALHMRALYRAGRQSEALASFEELRDLLDDQLGVRPGPDLAVLHQAILRHEPSLQAGTRDAEVRTNLPAGRTELVGRSDTITHATALLDGSRLLTLTGPGGVGKTRLALETAARRLEAFPDGVWLVELSSLDRTTRVSGVGDLVAAAMGLRDDTNAPALDDTGALAAAGEDASGLVNGRAFGGGGPLSAALRGKRALLVLDNCEHVIEPVAALVGQLLDAAPDLRVLATSREPLELLGEQVLTVPPLDLPEPPDDGHPATHGHPTAAGHTTNAGRVAEVGRSGAVRLFVARAGAAVPGFVLDEGNAEAVAKICRRLDGLPLALELAAAKVRSLGVHELAARLDDRFGVLTGRRRDVPERQRTLHAVIDWSWSLLTDPERVVLRHLAVHADGTTLEAAEYVCAAAEGGAPVLDLLTRLVDRSLVVMTENDLGPRYRLLESVAAYCLDRLDEAGDLKAARLRHRHYHVALAERAERHLRGHDQCRWLRRLDAECANMRAALEDAIREDAADEALRLANALAWYCVLRGRLGEGLRALDAALTTTDRTTPALSPTTPGHTTPALSPTTPGQAIPALSATTPGQAVPVLRATAVAWRTGLTRLAGNVPEQDDPPTSNQDWQQDDRWVMAEWFVAFAGIDFGDLAASEAGVGRALARFQGLDDQWGTAAALMSRAKQALVRGNLTALREDSARSLALFQQEGDRWGQLQSTNLLATLAEITGDYDQAMRLRREGLRMAEELELGNEIPYRLSALGRTALLTGDHAAADDFHRRALRAATDLANVLAQEYATIGLALGARRQGRLDEAEAYLRPWLDWNRRIAPDNGTALILVELGFIAELRGDAEAALALHLEGHAAARGTADPRAIALALEGLAGAEALRGGHVRAARLLGTAAEARRAAGAPLPPAERHDLDRITATVRSALGEEAFTSAYRSNSPQNDLL